MLAALGGYLEREMVAGRLEPMDPLLAVQALLGPLIFHLLTRPAAKQIAGIELPLDDVVDELCGAALRSLQPRTPGQGAATQE